MNYREQKKQKVKSYEREFIDLMNYREKKKAEQKVKFYFINLKLKERYI